MNSYGLRKSKIFILIKLLTSYRISYFYLFSIALIEKTKKILYYLPVIFVILYLLYFILWRRFIEATRHPLWVTKSMLTIISLEIIQKVPKIKNNLLVLQRIRSVFLIIDESTIFGRIAFILILKYSIHQFSIVLSLLQLLL